MPAISAHPRTPKHRLHIFWYDWKIREKTTSIVLVVLGLITFTLMVTSYLTISQQTIQLTGDQMVMLGDQLGQRVTGRIRESRTALETLAVSPRVIELVDTANLRSMGLSSQQIADRDQQWKDGSPDIQSLQEDLQGNVVSQYLREYIHKNAENVEVFITDQKGLVAATTGLTSDYVQSDEDWWQSAYADGKGNTFLAPVEYDESTGVYAIDMGVPVYNFNHTQVIGVLRGTVDVSAILESLSAIRLGESGQAAMLDANGMILASREEELIMQPAPQAIVDLMKSETLVRENRGPDLESDGEAVMVLVPLAKENGIDLGWWILLEQDVDEIDQIVIQKLLTSLLVALAVGLAAIGYVFWATTYITKPLKAATQVMTGLAGGDIRQEKTEWNYIQLISSQKDELGEMNRACLALYEYLCETAGVAEQVAQGNLTVSLAGRSTQDSFASALGHMLQKLNALVDRVATSAAQVRDSSGEMMGSASQAESAVNQIAVTIQQVARGTTQQSESVNQTVMSVEQMRRAIEGVAAGAQEQAAAIGKTSQVAGQISQSIQRVSHSALEVTHSSAQAAESARQGARTVEDTLQGMQTIRKKVGLSAERVREMGQRSMQIGAIVETIAEIASQTNLLALNAAIEAARAGEHGKGFAVVADEVRKLAERASRSTREIAELVGGIQTTVAEAVQAMEDSASEVESGANQASLSGQSLDHILSVVETVHQQAEHSSAAAGLMSAAVQELVGSVDTVSAVVEENTAASEQMSAASAEVSQAIENIAAVSEENSAAVEEVAASAEEMKSQVQDVASTAAELAGMAQDLQRVLAQFQLRLEEVPQVPRSENAVPI